MPDLCNCINTATRNKVNLSNNLCKRCEKPFRESDSVNNNSVDNEEHFYENTKYISEDSPIYTHTFDGNQTFSNFEESKNNCSCDNPQSNGNFCSNCGGLPIFGNPTSLFSGISKDDNNFLFGSVKSRPLTNLRRSHSVVGLLNDDLYTQIPIIPFRPEENIEPQELQKFANNFELNIPDDLDLFINRQLEIVRDEIPGGQIEPDLDREIEPEIAVEPVIILDNNPEIENPYDDVFNVNMEMLRFQNIRAPRFDAKKSNVRTFFRKFEQFRDGHHPAWNNEVTLNMLTNLMDDDSLDYSDTLPQETQGNYENLRDNMIEHYDMGSPLSTQWHDLNQRKQRDNETVTQYHDEILKLARPMHLAEEQTLLVFVNGLDENTKINLAMNNPPENLADALARAKTYQAVARTINPVKTLFRQIRDENLQTSAVTFDNNQQEINKKLEKKMEEIANQLSRLTSQIPNLQNHNFNNSQMAPQFPSQIMAPYLPSLPPLPQNFLPYNPQINFDSPRQNQGDNNYNNNFNNNSNYDNRKNKNDNRTNNNQNNREQFGNNRNYNNRNNRNNNNNNKNYNNNKNFNNNNNPNQNNTPQCNTIGEKKPPYKSVRERKIHYDSETMSYNAHIKGKHCNILFDTGSEVTLMTKRYFDSLNLGHLIEKARCERIKAVDNNTITILGQITLPIILENFEIIVTFQIIPDIHIDIIFGRDMMNKHIENIDYINSIITFRTPSKTCYELMDDTNVTLKGFLKEDITIFPHTEKKCFLKTEAIVDQTNFKSKGLVAVTAEKNVIVHDNSNVIMTSEGIPCKISNFTNDAVTLPQNTHVSWLKPLRKSSEIQVCSILNKTLTKKLSKIQHRRKVLSEIQQWFQEVRVNVISIEKKENQIQYNVNDSILSCPEKEKFYKLLEENSSSFAVNDSELGTIDIIKCEINVEKATPIRSQPYRVNYDTQQKIDQHITQMLKDDIIEPSISPWSSPVVLVKKKDTTNTRFCVDYRKLNKVTIKDSFPIPNIEEILDSLGNMKYYSTLDLRSGFFQIAMDEKSKQYTAFTCKNGLFEFKKLPFGLQNNPALFSRIMQCVLAGLNWKICINYIDDIIVFSKTLEEHLKNLQIIFDRLNSHNLKLNPKKCNFFQTDIKFLGHIISKDGIRVDPGKVEVLKNHSIPQNKKQLKSFLGLANYYRKYITDVAKIMEPLNKLLRKNVVYTWCEKCDLSFNILKTSLTSAPILGFPDFTTNFQLSVDACSDSIGFVLSQIQGGCEKVIAYAGRTLNKFERNYSINELEALSVVEGIKHFHVYLYGRPFKIFTDNSSITWLYRQKEPKGRIARWILQLLQYDFDIIYKTGKSNTNADAISRIPNLEYTLVTTVCDVEDKQKFLQAQKDDSELKEIFLAINSEKTDRRTRKIRQNFIISSDGLLHKIMKKTKIYDEIYRLVVPTSLKSQILQIYHNSILGGTHRGITQTFHKVHDRYYWRSMFREIDNYCRTCQKCIFTKPPREIKAPLQPLVAVSSFHTIYMDIIGPLPTTLSGNKYILNFVDSLTKWCEAIPIHKTDAVIVGKALYDHVICRHGCPKVLITDSASNFIAEVFSELCKILNINKLHISPYHPSSLGNVERYNQSLIRMISLYVSEFQTNWDEILKAVIFGYHTSRHSSTQETPFALLYGRRAGLPNDISLWNDSKLSPSNSENAQKIIQNIHIGQQIAKENNTRAQQKNKLRYDKKTTPVQFKVGDKVLLRDTRKRPGLNRKFLPNFKGPYTIAKQLTPVSFELNGTHNRMCKKAHSDRLKLYLGLEERIILPELNDNAQDNNISLDNSTSSENIVPIGNPNQLEEITLAENIITSEDSLPMENTTSVDNTVPLDQLVNLENIQEGDFHPDAHIEKIRWDDDFVILKHRSRHERMEYFVKQRNDPDSLGMWKKGQEINNNPITIEYMANLPKPNTRSRKPGSQIVNNIDTANNNTIFISPRENRSIPMKTNSIIEKLSNHKVLNQENEGNCIPKVYTIFKQNRFFSPKPRFIFLFYFTFILSINHFSCSQPDLGFLYDCSNVTKVGLYSVPAETYCSRFHLKDIRHMSVEVKQYKEKITNIKLFLCSTEKIILFCREKFFGSDEKKIQKIILPTSYKVCFNAVRYKNTPYGRLKKSKHNLWISSGIKSFKCQWMKNTHVSFTRFKLLLLNGHLVDYDFKIQQDLTNTECVYNLKFCRPKENPFNIIVWINTIHNPSIYKSLGYHNATLVQNFVLISSLGIGGGIIYKQTNFWLLDIGYVIIKQTGNNSHTKNQEILDKFYNFSRNYVKSTKSNVQRELAEGQLIRSLILENKLFTSLSSMLCRVNSKIHNIQRFMLTQFPEISHDLLFPESRGFSWNRQAMLYCFINAREFRNTKFSGIKNLIKHAMIYFQS